MGTIWPRSGSMEFNSSGAPATGALAYFYEAGTTTPLAVYEDGDETTPHEFPLEADGTGRWPAVFVPFGTYKFVLKTSGGTTLFTADDVPNPEPFDETFAVDETAQLNTGDVWWSPLDATRTGAVRLNGRTMGSAASGGTERANADTEDLFTFLWNNLANGQAAVSGGRGASAAADFAANKTIALPDLRGALPIGLTDMGNSDSGGLASAPVTNGDSITPGSVLGANTHTLTTAQLAQHLHTVSITSGIESAEHKHSISITSGDQSVTHSHIGTTDGQSATHTHTGAVGTVGTTTFQAGATLGVNSVGTTNTGNASVDHTHTFTTGNASGGHTHDVAGLSAGQNANHTHAVSGNTGNNGSGSAHNIVSKVITGTWFIKL